MQTCFLLFLLFSKYSSGSSGQINLCQKKIEGKLKPNVAKSANYNVSLIITSENVDFCGDKEDFIFYFCISRIIIDDK